MNYVWIVEERTPSCPDSVWRASLNACTSDSRREARFHAKQMRKKYSDIECRIRKYVREEK